MATANELRYIATNVEDSSQISAHDYATVCRALADFIEQAAEKKQKDIAPQG